MTMTTEPFGPKPKKFITLPRAIVYGVLLVCCVFFLFPLYIMVITSLKDLDAVREGNLFTPSNNMTFVP
jgi:glucose/mannose transport system permease protein